MQGVTITVGGPSAEGEQPSTEVMLFSDGHRGGVAVSILEVIALLSFGLACFRAGYAIGKSAKK